MGYSDRVTETRMTPKIPTFSTYDVGKVDPTDEMDIDDFPQHRDWAAAGESFEALYQAYRSQLLGRRSVPRRRQW